MSSEAIGSKELPRGEVPDAVTPPLGCPFHPRCPSAFEVCGWESRDLRTMLEARWTRLEEEEYEAERAVIGDLATLDEPGMEGRIEAAADYDGTDVREIVERLRQDAPDDPFWKGVREVETGATDVTVRFNDPLVPRPVRAGEAQVLCHLHDPEALERARAVTFRDG